MGSKRQSPPTPPASERSHGKSQPERQNDATMDRSVIPHREPAENSDGQLAQRKPTGHQEALERPVAGEVAHHDDGRGGAPAVRLDMDLDVEVELKAKIQGDITLSIL